MVGYFRKFVKDFAGKAAPLHELLPNDASFNWGPKQQVAFDTLVEAVTSKPVLCSPVWDEPFVLETDASDVAIAGVLMQGGRPIAYASRSLSPAEKNYTPMDRECLAIIEYTRYFDYYFEGTDWSVLTDNQPIKHIFDMKNPRGRHARWLLEFQNLHGHVQWRKGSDNVVADYLTRLPPELGDQVVAAVRMADELTPDLEEIKAAQQADRDLQDAATKVQTSDNSWTKVCMIKRKGLWYMDDRLLIPKSIAQRLTEAWHNAPTLGHSGANKLYKMMSKYFFWPGIKYTVRSVVKACTICQKLKGNPPPSRIHPELGVEALKCWQVDFSHIAPESKEGHKYLLVVIDVGTRYPFAVACKNETVKCVAQAIIENVLPILGIPEVIHSDNGPAFVSKLWGALCQLLGVRPRISPPFSPQGKGIVERTIQTLKHKLNYLAASKGEFQGGDKWHEALPYIIWGLRANPGSVGVSPSETLMGIKMMLPHEAAVTLPSTYRSLKPAERDAIDLMKARLELVRAATQERLDNEAVVRAARDDYVPPAVFQVGDKVLITHVHTAANANLGKSNTRYRGPYEVKKALRYNVYVLKKVGDPKSKTSTCHARMMKLVDNNTVGDFPKDVTRWDSDKYRHQRRENERKRTARNAPPVPVPRRKTGPQKRERNQDETASEGRTNQRGEQTTQKDENDGECSSESDGN
jgi:transposase InsO family protein